MDECQVITKHVRRNWLIDVGLFLAALGATITGIYFLIFPVGGYQGGRNPYYGITVLFDRETWDILHAWTGVLMIAAVLIHLVWHWNWLKGAARRIFGELVRGIRQIGLRSRLNAAMDTLIALGFLLSAASGVYFLLAPGGISGHNLQPFLFSPAAWDVIHTWSSIMMLIGIMVHLALHWSWIKSVSMRCLMPAGKVRILKKQNEISA